MKAQRLQLAQALLKIAPNVTPGDRTKCAQQLNISKQTICYYLNGRVTNNDRGVRVLEFLIECINNRQKEIQQLCQ